MADAAARQLQYEYKAVSLFILINLQKKSNITQLFGFYFYTFGFVFIKFLCYFILEFKSRITS